MANPIHEKGLVADRYGRPMLTDAQALVANVATTGSTTTTPYGYTTAAQADAIVTTINSILDILKTHGLMKDA